MTMTQLSHNDSLTNNHHNSEEMDEYMQFCTEEEAVNEIDMWSEPVEVELPTNGLDEIVDWDTIERGLAAGKYAWTGDVRKEVEAMFEAADAKFSRWRYRMAIEGLFPEFRKMYQSLSVDPGRAALVVA